MTLTTWPACALVKFKTELSDAPHSGHATRGGKRGEIDGGCDANRLTNAGNSGKGGLKADISRDLYVAALPDYLKRQSESVPMGLATHEFFGSSKRGVRHSDRSIKLRVALFFYGHPALLEHVLPGSKSEKDLSLADRHSSTEANYAS